MEPMNPPQDAAYTPLSQIPIPVPHGSANFPPEICAALVDAQADVQMVGKGGWNDHHKYKYASGDDMIAEARRVLNKHGVAVVPVRWVMTETPYQWTDWTARTEDGKPVKDASGEQVYDPVQIDDVRLRLFVTMRLIHRSGVQHLCDAFHVPVIPDRGRPLDKAESAARTYALSYFLRDLLQIPRGDEDKDAVDQRDDRGRNHNSGKARAPQRQPQPQPQRQNRTQSPPPYDDGPPQGGPEDHGDGRGGFNTSGDFPASEGWGTGGPQHTGPDNATEADIKHALDSLKADHPDHYDATKALLVTGYGAPPAQPWQIARGKHEDAYKEIKAAYKRAARAKASGGNG